MEQPGAVVVARVGSVRVLPVVAIVFAATKLRDCSIATIMDEAAYRRPQCGALMSKRPKRPRDFTQAASLGRGTGQGPGGSKQGTASRGKGRQS